MENKQKKANTIASEFKRFADVTLFNGLKELIEMEGIFLVKFLWAIFLLVCLGLMFYQLVLACIAFRAEITFTTVTLEEVPVDMNHSMTLCFKMSTLFNNKINIYNMDTYEQAVMFGYFHPGLFILNYLGDLWITTDKNATINLDELANLTSVSELHDFTNQTFVKRLEKVLDALNIKFIQSLRILGTVGSKIGNFCFQIDLTDDPAVWNQWYDVMIGIYRNNELEAAFSYYSTTSNIFQTRQTHATKLKSAKLLGENATGTGYSISDYPGSYTYGILSSEKFIFLDLNRNPCEETNPQFIIPPGNGGVSACTSSCLMDGFNLDYNCSFGFHLNIVDSNVFENQCNWVDIINQFQAKMRQNCSTGNGGIKLSDLADAGVMDDTGNANYYDYYNYYSNFFAFDPSIVNETTPNPTTTPEPTTVDPDSDSVCSADLDLTTWKKVLIYLLQQDMETKHEARCAAKCKNYRPCIQWDIDYGKVKTEAFTPDDYAEELAIYAEKPDTITIYTETLQTDLPKLISNIGGIFGFYFGFSIVAIMHVLFFCVGRYLAQKRHDHGHRDA